MIKFLLFDDFETLDLLGPVEILARVEGHNLQYTSIAGQNIRSAQGMSIKTEKLAWDEEPYILVIPGGRGTRTLIKNELFIKYLREACTNAEYVLTICTGSALLAKTGLLDRRTATSNKKAFAWVESVTDKVRWVRHARWVTDGKFYTSSGVSAGMDMALGFVADQYGEEKAERIAEDIEYLWNKTKEEDFFDKSNIK